MDTGCTRPGWLAFFKGRLRSAEDGDSPVDFSLLNFNRNGEEYNIILLICISIVLQYVLSNNLHDRKQLQHQDHQI